MLKSFLYHCRIIKSHGWLIPFTIFAIGVLGAYIGGTHGVSARVGILLITVFTPFLTFALASSSGQGGYDMLIKSLPMTKKERLKGRYLFIYFAISVSVFISLMAVKAALYYNKMSFGGSFNQNFAEIAFLFWCGLILIHSIMLPFILFKFNFMVFLLFMVFQTILLIFVSSDLVYLVINPIYLLIIFMVSVISIPLSYNLSVKSDPENKEEA